MWDSTFEELLDEYTEPSSVFGIEAWETSDLVHLSNLIDIELQKRYDASRVRAERQAAAQPVGLPDHPWVHTSYGGTD